jgi:RNA polymerase sigma factor (sigma-70 family)
MTTTRAGIVLRHIRTLAAAPACLGDRQLLERFTAFRDEAAFAALVRLHGPMVHGVCRRVLGNTHDADDAFQATFLIFAGRAASVSKSESLAGWLYRVAYNTALKARGRAAARRRREQRSGDRSCADPLTELTGRELLGVLDEELQRLPERCRLPLVLCYLEGLTRDEAAGRLGCSPSTLKRRLGEGRQRLRGRLERRGLALSAALLTAGIGAAAVSPALAAATVAGVLLVAAGKRPDVSAGVAALLTRGVGARSWKAAALMAAVLIAGAAGALAYRAPADARAAPPQAPAEPAKAPPSAAKEETTLTGRVVGADGKPVGEVYVALVGMPANRHPFVSGWLDEKALARGKTDAEGRFRISLAGAARQRYPDIFAVAGKEGHGLIWGKVPRAGDASDFVLRLSAEKVVRGRVIDLQGLAVVGAEVRLNWLGGRGDERHVDVGVWGLPKDEFPVWPSPTKTDKEGKFVLRGLNPALEGSVTVDGEEYAPQSAPIRAGTDARAADMKFVLLPAVIVEGVVTAEDTGKPLAGALLRPWSGEPLRTDDKGRFHFRPQLEGTHRIEVTAPDGQPYLPLEVTADWPKRAVRHEVNLALPRGVLVRGKVTDAASGKPIAGAVIFDGAALWLRSVKSGADGSFAIAVAPGRSPLLVKGPDNDYVATQVTSKELFRDTPPYSRSYPDAVIPLDVKAGAAPVDVSAKLRRGVTIRGRLLDPDGKPVREAVLLCWSQLTRHSLSWFASPAAVRDGEFELRGCDPEETYPVHFLDARHQWGASAKVSAKQAGDKPPTVRLEKCGRAVVRFVNKEGKPVPDYSPYVNIVIRPGAGEVGDDSDFVANVDHLNYHGGGGRVTGADGRATCPALIPGVTYRLSGPGMKDVEVRAGAGETRQLPDVVVEP